MIEEDINHLIYISALIALAVGPGVSISNIDPGQLEFSMSRSHVVLEIYPCSACGKSEERQSPGTASHRIHLECEANEQPALLFGCSPT